MNIHKDDLLITISGNSTIFMEHASTNRLVITELVYTRTLGPIARGKYSGWYIETANIAHHFRRRDLRRF